MIDFWTAKIEGHRRNIQRYIRLLATELTEFERQYLHNQIAEEQAELMRLELETTRGEQLLADCRGVLGQMGSLGERIELLKRGDFGVLKLAAPPQTIESVLPGFCRGMPKTSQCARESNGSSWDGSGAAAGARRGSYRHPA